jgi:hypothetical protein
MTSKCENCGTKLVRFDFGPFRKNASLSCNRCGKVGCFRCFLSDRKNRERPFSIEREWEGDIHYCSLDCASRELFPSSSLRPEMLATRDPRIKRKYQSNMKRVEEEQKKLMKKYLKYLTPKLHEILKRYQYSVFPEEGDLPCDDLYLIEDMEEDAEKVIPDIDGIRKPFKWSEMDLTVGEILFMIKLKFIDDEMRELEREIEHRKEITPEEMVEKLLHEHLLNSTEKLSSLGNVEKPEELLDDPYIPTLIDMAKLLIMKYKGKFVDQAKLASHFSAILTKMTQ